MKGLHRAINRIRTLVSEGRDVFNVPITNTTTNESNLAGHYPYSPERWRLFSDTDTTTRLFPEYNEVPQYDHRGDYHALQPASGETVVFETAERYRYRVQFELEATFAFAINQELQGNDYVRCGFYDTDNGWFLEHNGGHNPDEFDAVALRAGTELYRETNTIYSDDFLSNTRYGLETAWYDVTRQRWSESYSDAGDQQNKTIATVSNDSQRGPEMGNLLLRFEVQADANTTGLELQAGSAAVITKGAGTTNSRTKAIAYAGADADTINETDVWVPLRAFREIPGRKVINNQLLSMSALSYSQDTPVTLALLSFDQTNVTFTGADSWGTPESWTRQNNALEVRADVDQYVDNSGALVTSTTNPGGFQIGYAVLAPTSGSKFQKGASELQLGAKRNIPNGDVAVLVGKAANTGDVGHAETFVEDW